jgi:hypothetical protein
LMLVVVGRKEKNFKMEELCEDTIDCLPSHVT